MAPTISRDELVNTYGVSQGYLGYLLREKKIPLPVRINGEILWYADEVKDSLPKIMPFLAKRAKSNTNLKVIN